MTVADPDERATTRCRCWCHRHFITVVEAAGVVAISRAQAYELAALYRRSEGTEGLPVVSIGHALRVPVAVLRDWCGLSSGARTCSRCGHASIKAVDSWP